MPPTQPLAIKQPQGRVRDAIYVTARIAALVFIAIPAFYPDRDPDHSFSLSFFHCQVVEMSVQKSKDFPNGIMKVIDFSFTGKAYGLGTVYVIALILFAFWALRESIRISLKRDSRPGEALFSLIYCVLYILTLFTGLYYSFGINGAFEVNSKAASLDNFQAFFFALGVLGTGTGNIVAHRELILGFQTAQMAADLILIGVAVVLAVNRLTPTRDSSTSREVRPPQETRPPGDAARN